jgi:hypothetical protein
MMRADQLIPIITGIIVLIILSWGGPHILEDLHPSDPTLSEGLYEGITDLSGPLPAPIFLNVFILIIIVVITLGAMNILVKEPER